MLVLNWIFFFLQPDNVSKTPFQIRRQGDITAHFKSHGFDTGIDSWPILKLVISFGATTQ